MFGGPGEGVNLVPMDAKLNGASGEWYALEREWKRILSSNGSVTVKIEPVYSSNNKRPKEFIVNQAINGVTLETVILKNTPTGK